MDLFAGDLAGVRAKIPYFKELGLTYLHLMPLFRTPPGDDDGGIDRGAVWILFLRQDGTVLDEAKISANDGNFGADLNDGDRFGTALAVLGDLDGNGAADIAVGAPGDDEGELDAGAVWILFMNSNGTVRTKQKIAFDTGGLDAFLHSGDAFGAAIANLYPDLSLTGSVGESGDRINDLDLENFVFNLVANITGPLFTGGQRRADVGAARSRAEQAAAIYAGQVLEALREVEEALVLDEASRGNYKFSSDRVEEANLFFVRTVAWVTAVGHGQVVKRALFGAAKGKTDC